MVHSGVECMVTASVSTIKGGAMNEVSVMKSLRLGEIAFENRLPCISLIQSVSKSNFFPFAWYVNPHHAAKGGSGPAPAG